jgi:hypothetical protein
LNRYLNCQRTNPEDKSAGLRHSGLKRVQRRR